MNIQKGANTVASAVAIVKPIAAASVMTLAASMALMSTHRHKGALVSASMARPDVPAGNTAYNSATAFTFTCLIRRS